jgi:phosphoribosylformylglycinamidine (FGAM) synthase-like amidotransferase family enzyme
MTVFVLRGEGIECETESFRFFSSLPQFDFRCVYLDLPKITHHTVQNIPFSKNDWLFLPGGFSFADHFGSGRLLAFELQQKGLLEKALDSGVNLWGVCNGFQALVSSGLFGKEFSLRSNQKSQGFINRWIQLQGLSQFSGQTFYLPVRHGEGRLCFEGHQWPQDVIPLLQYNDSSFDNGSYNQIAALARKVKESWVVGMMPHPEIAVAKFLEPNAVPVETKITTPGDGVRLAQTIKEIFCG